MNLHHLKKPAKAAARILRYKHLYVAVIIGFLVFYKAFWSPDILFLVFLTIFAIYGQAKEYIRKFTPVVALLISYDALRGIVPLISHRVHYFEMINIDKWMFGGYLPTNVLQSWWHQAGVLHWFDYYFYALYMLHFLIPFFIAALIWKRRPNSYWQFGGALLALSYAGFITYVAFPAAPPWMAAEMHLIPAITKISTEVWWAWGVHNIPNIYAQFNPNPVAAVPSLHSAYPMLELLFVNKLFGRRAAALFFIYPLSMWIGVVYMGEHYVIDVILGILYATGAFFLSELVIAKGWHRPVISRVKRLVPRHGGQPVAAPGSKQAPEA